MSIDDKYEIPGTIYITERTPEERALFIQKMIKLHKDFNKKIRQNAIEHPVLFL
jgi:hypothetical protein